MKRRGSAPCRPGGSEVKPSVSLRWLADTPTGFAVAAAFVGASEILVSRFAPERRAFMSVSTLVVSASAFVWMLARASRGGGADAKRRPSGRVSEARYGGVVKRFSQRHRWGLIGLTESLDEAALKYEVAAGRDVRFYDSEREALGLAQGDVVEFCLAHDEHAQGWFRAADLRLSTTSASVSHGSPAGCAHAGRARPWDARDSSLPCVQPQAPHVSVPSAEVAGIAPGCQASNHEMGHSSEQMRKFVEGATQDEIQEFINQRLRRS